MTEADLNINAVRPHVLAHTRQRLAALFGAIDPMFKEGEVLHHFAPGYAPPALPFLSVKWMAFSMPFPLWARDFVLLEYNDVVLDSTGVPCALVVCKSLPCRLRPPSDPSKALVRAELLRCSYVFRQVSASPPRAQVIMRAQADPKGSIPKWALTFVIKEQAKNLQRLVQWAAAIPDVATPYQPAPGIPRIQDVLASSPAQLLARARAAVQLAAPAPPLPTPSSPSSALHVLLSALVQGTPLPPGALAGAPVFGRVLRSGWEPARDAPPHSTARTPGSGCVPVPPPPDLCVGALGACHVAGPTALREAAQALAGQPCLANLITALQSLGADPVACIGDALAARAALAKGGRPPRPLLLLAFHRPPDAPHSVVKGTWSSALALACRLYPSFTPAFKRALPVLQSVSFGTLEAQFRSARPGLVAELAQWEGAADVSPHASLFQRLARSPFAEGGYTALTQADGEDAMAYDVRYFLFLRMGLPGSFTGSGRLAGRGGTDWLACPPRLAFVDARGSDRAAHGAGSTHAAAIAVDFTQAAVAMLPAEGSTQHLALRRALQQAKRHRGREPQQLGKALWSVATGKAPAEHEDGKVRHWMQSGAFIAGVAGAVALAALYGGPAFDWAAGMAGDATHWLVQHVDAAQGLLVSGGAGIAAQAPGSRTKPSKRQALSAAGPAGR